MNLALNRNDRTQRFQFISTLSVPEFHFGVLRSVWARAHARSPQKRTRQNKLRLKYFNDSHLVINYIIYKTHLSCEYCVRLCANKKMSNNIGILIISLIIPENYFFSGFLLLISYTIIPVLSRWASHLVWFLRNKMKPAVPKLEFYSNFGRKRAEILIKCSQPRDW